MLFHEGVVKSFEQRACSGFVRIWWGVQRGFSRAFGRVLQVVPRAHEVLAGYTLNPKP